MVIYLLHLYIAVS